MTTFKTLGWVAVLAAGMLAVGCTPTKTKTGCSSTADWASGETCSAGACVASGTGGGVTGGGTGGGVTGGGVTGGGVTGGGVTGGGTGGGVTGGGTGGGSHLPTDGGIAGDDCATALTVTPGTTLNGQALTDGGATDDYNTTGTNCAGYNGGRDLVYAVTVPAGQRAA
jgi:hypothetical protein